MMIVVAWASATLLAIVPILLWHAVTGRAGRAAAGKLISRYSEPQPPSSSSGWLTRLLAAARRDQQIADRLAAAGISRRPAEWVTGWVAAAAAAGTAAGAAAGIPAGVITAAVTGAGGSKITLGVRAARRRAAFADSLPDFLSLLAGSLRTGLSLPHALERVAADAAEPVSSEIGQAVAAMRVGAAAEDALEAAAARMRSGDLQWVVQVMGIHRQIGGNLGEVLDSTARTMNSRAAMRRHVLAMSAEGRLSGRILVALPILIGVWMIVTDRAYVRPLWTTPAGLVMSAAAVLLTCLGALWMRAVVKAGD